MNGVERIPGANVDRVLGRGLRAGALPRKRRSTGPRAPFRSRRSTRPEDDGRTRIAVNLRLADDPGDVASIPLQRFEGLSSFEDLPRDGRQFAHVWF